MIQRFYIRVIDRKGHTRLHGDYASRKQAKAALAKAAKRRPGIVRRVDSCMVKSYRTKAGVIVEGLQYDIEFCCTTPGPEPEIGFITGHWNGDIDTWGKLTIIPANDRIPTHYLFAKDFAELLEIAS
jgi:hypothetical protein